MNNEIEQENTFNLERWLIPLRVKKGMWPHLRLLLKTQLADIMLEWCYALSEAVIDGGGNVNYIDILTSKSSIVTARIICDSLVALDVTPLDICNALTHRQPGVDTAELMKFLQKNDPTLSTRF